MQQFHDQALENMIKGWTRIDMLLALYGRTILSVKSAQAAYSSGDQGTYAEKVVEAHRLILGLHSGLNTEKFPIAVDVARLLNFVSLRLEEKKFDESIRFLEKLYESFAQIRDEAADLEKQGKIPPLNDTCSLDTMA